MSNYAVQLRDRLTIAAASVTGDHRLGQPVRDAAADVMLEADIVPAMQAMVALIVALEDAEDAAKRATEQARAALREALDGTSGSIRTPLFTASVSKPRASVQVIDESVIPADYFETITRPDRARLAAALKGGERIPGVELRNGAPILTIRSNIKGEAA